MNKARRRKGYMKEYRERPENKVRMKEYKKKYYLENEEKIKSKNKEYYQRSEVKARIKKYLEENREKIRVKRKDYCQRPEIKERHREYYKKNKKRISLRTKIYNQNPEVEEKLKVYREKNKEKTREYDKIRRVEKKEIIKEYLNRPEVKIRNKLRNRRYYQIPEVRKRIRAQTKKRLKTNPKYKISHNISTHLWRSLKYVGSSKNGCSWEKLVGYGVDELKAHLEKQFKKGMTWKNYGTHWHIDHRIPVSWFSFTSTEDESFKDCWALNNLQPLRAISNVRKSNCYSEPTLKQIMEGEEDAYANN